MAFGFQGMQFNSVFWINKAAVLLWQKHGSKIVGTLSKLLNHSAYDLVDVFGTCNMLGTQLKKALACQTLSVLVQDHMTAQQQPSKTSLYNSLN